MLGCASISHFHRSQELGISVHRLKRHSLDKVHRWRLVLDDKRYIIESIAGLDNVWADIATPWAAQRSAVVAKVSVPRSINPRIVPGQVQPLQRNEFCWPSLVDVKQSQ